MPSERQIAKAIKELRKNRLYPTPHRIAKELGCKVQDLPELPTLTVEEVKAAASKLKFPSIDGVCKALGAPYPLVRRLYLEADLPLLKRGRPEKTNEAENELIKNWNGTDIALAKKLGELNGRTYTKEAIRQKRQKLGVTLERQRWKDQAMAELKAGIRPAVVAHKYGYNITTVENWYNDL